MRSQADAGKAATAAAPEQDAPGQGAQDGGHGFGVDEDNHGWPPDSGGASEAVRQGNQKAFDASNAPEPSGDAEDASPDPDDPRLPPETVGQSTNRRGEDVMGHDGKEPGRQDTGPMGASQRPTGTSTARDQTGVDPQEPIEP